MALLGRLMGQSCVGTSPAKSRKRRAETATALPSQIYGLGVRWPSGQSTGPPLPTKSTMAQWSSRR